MTDTPPINHGQHPAAAPIEDRVLLSWVSLPAKSRPTAAILVGLFLVVLVIVVYMMTFSAMFTAIAAVILWGSLSQFYVRTNFELTERFARVKYIVNKVEREWSQFRSYYPDKNGVLLSPFARPSRLENFRGLYIRFAGNKDEVLAIVKSKIVIPKDLAA